MLYFDVDARDGGPAGTCNTCCCQSMTLRPGETNRMMLNYAPWALPLGWVVPTPQFTIETDNSSCPTGEQDGFVDPTNTNYSLTTPAGAPLNIDLSDNVAPPNNEFTYRLLGLAGVEHGSLVQVGTSGGPLFMYTPAPGFQGYDYFDFQTEDAQGRTITNTVTINVGQHSQRRDNSRTATVPYIDRNAIVVDRQMQTVSFPIHMPVSVDNCQSFRLTIRQPAKDCDGNLYQHLACFDISPKTCG